MAEQGIERREVLRAMALGAAASGFPGFQRWTFAHDHAQTGTRAPAAPYQPQFFSAEEYATVERLAELIVPSDETPGAREAGVSEFIDFMAASDPKIQFRFRYGLAWLDAHALRLFGSSFRALAAGQQNEILERLAYRQKHRVGEHEGRAFFRLVRDYTVMGFYSSRVGLQALEYPGLRLYADSPECTHPEHIGPPAPGSKA